MLRGAHCACPTCRAGTEALLVGRQHQSVSRPWALLRAASGHFRPQAQPQRQTPRRSLPPYPGDRAGPGEQNRQVTAGWISSQQRICGLAFWTPTQRRCKARMPYGAVLTHSRGRSQPCITSGTRVAQRPGHKLSRSLTSSSTSCSW